MAYRRFNKMVLGITALVPAGVTVNPADIVTGGGVYYIKPKIDQSTTLNHVIHRVPTEEKGYLTVHLYGNKESLASQRTTDGVGGYDTAAADMGNFGGQHKIYLSVTGSADTLLATFDGLVDAEYIPEIRQTKITINGEYHGIT